MQPKTLIKALIACQIILLQGCNGGLSAPGQGAAVAAHSDSEAAQGSNLPRVELGWGYDPRTGRVKKTGNFKLGELLDFDGGSVLVQQASEKEDYSTYDKGLSSDSSTKSSNLSGGIGANWGLYSASLKAATANLVTAANGQITINKRVGVVQGTTTSFDLDEDSDSLSAKSRTIAAAIYTAASSDFRNLIDGIRQARTEWDRQQLIREFYKAYGPDFIYTKKVGVKGYIDIKLTQKAANGSEASKLDTEAAFSSPWVKGQLNYSNDKSAAFKKENWDYSMHSYVSPNIPEIKTELDKLLAKMDKDIKDQNGISLDDVTKMQEEARKKIKTPDLSNLNVIPDPKAAAEAKAKKEELNKAIEVLNDLGELYDVITGNLEKRDNNEASAFMTRYRNSGLLTDFKTKLDGINKLKNVAFSSSDAAKLRKFNSFSRAIKLNPEITYKEIVAQANKDEAPLARQANMDKGNPQFKNWLKQEHPEDFDNWFKKLQPAELTAYIEGYRKYLIDNNYVAIDQAGGKSGAANGSALRSAMNDEVELTAAAIEARAAASEDSPEVYATLDFGIMPWAKIFPELNSYEEILVGPEDIVYQKFIEKLTRVIDIRSYLELCQFTTKDNELSNMFTADKLNPALDRIRYVLDNLSVGARKIKFGGIEYNLDNIEDIKALDKAIDATVNELAMAKSQWYKVANKLYDNELILPQGSVLGIDSEGVTGMLSAEHPFASSDSNDYDVVGRSPLSDTVGHQIATLYGNKKNYRVLTGEIIATSKSKLRDADSIADVQVLFSEKVSGPWRVRQETLPYFTLSLKKNRFNAYQSMNGTALLRVARVNGNDYWKVEEHGRRTDTNPVLNLFPLNTFNLQTLVTDMGENKVKEVNPLFRMYYPSNSPLVDKLFNHYTAN